MRGSTIDQLRHDIDTGRTGDKVAGSDPAAVPLGTDEEAAGTPIPSDVTDEVRVFETEKSGLASLFDEPDEAESPGGMWFAVGAGISAAAIAVAVVIS